MSFDVRLNPGDYFIDVGVNAVDMTTAGVALDVRRSVMHFTVVAASRFPREGIVDLATKYSVVD